MVNRKRREFNYGLKRETGCAADIELPGQKERNQWKRNGGVKQTNARTLTRLNPNPKESMVVLVVFRRDVVHPQHNKERRYGSYLQTKKKATTEKVR